MRVVAGDAVSLGARMLDFCLFNVLRLRGVTCDAESPRIRVRENDFSILGRSVANFARLVGERRMRELLQQFGLR